MSKKIWLITLLLLSFSVGFAQNKIIEKSVFEKIIEQAEDKTDKSIHRSIRVIEYYDKADQPATKITREIRELIPPNKSYTRLEEDGKIEELIIIGERRFFKENGGKWREDKTSGIGSGTGSGHRLLDESFEVIENTEFEGKKASFYQTIKNISDYSDDSPAKETWTSKYWIAPNGLMLKTEDLTEKKETKKLIKYTVVYQYDPKIRIRVPVK